MQTKMEHRMNVRFPVCLSATVYYAVHGSRKSFCTVTRDLSFEGAFVAAGQTRPAKGTIVRLALEAAFGDTVMIDALVLRGDGDGFGVMFIYDGDHVSRQLASLLRPALKRRYAYGRR